MSHPVKHDIKPVKKHEAEPEASEPSVEPVASAPSNPDEPTNPYPPTPAPGSEFSSDPATNPAAYGSNPETPGANPAHTSEAIAKRKGLEVGTPVVTPVAAEK